MLVPGPDGIWIDHHTKGLIAFELKNEKGESSEISKSDIGQCHDHLEWVKSKYPDYRHLGLIIYTQAKKISDQANPTSDMHLVDFAAMKKLFGEFNSTISDLSQLTPVERFATANQIGENPNWSIDGIFARLVGNEP